MTAVRGYTIRAPGLDEVPAIAALVNALARSLHGEDEVDEDEVRRWLTGPKVDRVRDLRVAELPDGRLGGFASVVDLADDHAIIWLHVVLHPERGTLAMGEELLQLSEARARERGVPGSLVHPSASSEDERARRLYERHGYELVRHFFRMQIDFDGPPPTPAWPEGFELRPFELERDATRVFEADDEAFADHWGHFSVDFAAWKHWLVDDRFDPSLWFVAYAGDEVAGFSICKPDHPSDASMGWVEVLGVRRPWRRRGLALALLQHSFVELHRRGRKRAGLGVDAENTTGAVRLYERAGMRPVRRWDTWEKRL